MHVSVIICTYNPNEEVFQRCLNAVSNQKMGDISLEGHIIDNNCKPSLDSFEYVRQFLKSNLEFKIIKEPKPGLTFARIAGIRRSTGDICIFIDDDNEPEENYFREASRIGNEHNELGAWGSGNTSVEYTGNPPQWANNFKTNFQEESFEEPIISNKKTGNMGFPSGTGLVIRRQIALDYCENAESGNYSATDRTGRSLVSAGDLQLSMNAVKMGYYLGVFPKLKINHLIEDRKATMAYLKKHAFGIASSYDCALLGVFPELLDDVKDITPSKTIAFKSIAKYCLTNNPLSREYPILLARELGHIYSKYSALGIKIPYWMRILLRAAKAN